MKFDGKTGAAGLLNLFDVSVDAGRESLEDFFCVGRVARVFGVHVAAIAEQSGVDVALDKRGAKNLREAALAGALPELHLKQAVLRDDKALREKEIVLILSKDMRDAPAVALDSNRGTQARQMEGAANFRESTFGARFESCWSGGTRRHPTWRGGAADQYSAEG